MLSEEKMRNLGFTDNIPDQWYYFAPLTDDVTLNIKIDKDSGDYTIDILRENGLTPYEPVLNVERTKLVEGQAVTEFQEVQYNLAKNLEYLNNQGLALDLKH